MSIRNTYPTIRPSLNLNFARSRTLDPRITFTRTSTGTYMDSDGLIKTAIADQPRFDHRYVNGQIESLGLLVEEQRTNLCYYGTTIQNFATRGTGTPIKTANATTAPDGTVTATRLQGDGTATPYFDDNSNKEYIAGRAYTFSCFFKANGTDEVYILLYGTNWNGSGGTNVVGHFDLTTGTSLGAAGGGERDPTGGARIEQYPNGWYRCSITETCATTHNANHQLIRGVGLSADIYAWGYQIEHYSSFPSSLIPTTTNQTASRTKEYAKISGSDFENFYNPLEGTIYVRYDMKGYYATDGFNRIFELSDGASNRYTALLRGTNSDIYESGFGGELSFNTSTIVFGEQQKWVAAHKQNDFQRYAYDANGNLDSNTDTTLTVSNLSATELNIGYEAINDVRQLNGHISELRYYSKRLSNTQLQNLIK